MKTRDRPDRNLAAPPTVSNRPAVAPWRPEIMLATSIAATFPRPARWCWPSRPPAGGPRRPAGHARTLLGLARGGSADAGQGAARTPATGPSRPRQPASASRRRSPPIGRRPPGRRTDRNLAAGLGADGGAGTAMSTTSPTSNVYCCRRRRRGPSPGPGRPRIVLRLRALVLVAAAPDRCARSWPPLRRFGPDRRSSRRPLFWSSAPIVLATVPRRPPAPPSHRLRRRPHAAPLASPRVRVASRQSAPGLTAVHPAGRIRARTMQLRIIPKKAGRRHTAPDHSPPPRCARAASA